MGAVAGGALGAAVVLALVALRLVAWRRRSTSAVDPVVDLSAAEAALRAESLAFDGIVGHLLLTDPTFADTADRLARQDDTGPAA